MDEKEIPHLILTRFNLAIKFGCDKREDSKIPDKPWLDEKYLEQRFAVFEKYTFLSLLSQTDQKFRWIVLFHQDTPEKYKKKIAILSDKMNQFEPWFMNDDECEHYGMILSKYISGQYAGTEVITTRLDNDDFVHESFVGAIKIQICIDNKAKFLSFMNGLQYDVRNGQFLSYHYPNNHFLSLYVPCAKEMNNHILLFNHDEIDVVAEREHLTKVEKKTDIPLWVEIVTETNFSNTPRWRFSTICIPYKIINEFSGKFERKEYSRIQWLCTYFKRGGWYFIIVVKV